MTSKKNQENDIVQTLGLEASLGRKKRLKTWFVVAFLVAAAAIATFLVLKRTQASNEVVYKTEVAKRGNILITVTATGNLQPRNQVDVGSELSGIIERVEADYNTRVTVGQALAKLDTSKLLAQVLQAKAALESARAKVLQAQATLKESRNNLDRLKRVRELSNGKVPSQNDMEAAEAALDRAQANEAIAKADVSQALAGLETMETDLAKAVIRSPINGIVLARNVEPGQTVAASLQAPILFTLAEDLTQMELIVNVDEADVGQVKDGQKARFTVDAYPNRNFDAQITQVRFGAQITSGVVTYQSVLSLDNSDLSLRPGMTATADITVKEVLDTIMVPNAALRFTPQVKEKGASGNQKNLVNSLLPGPRRRNSQQRQGPGNFMKGTPPWMSGAGGAGRMKKQGQVWTLQDGKPFPVSVMIGASDGVMTEITGGDVTPGMALVVDQVGAS